ncbi:hypothetical protein DOY81_013497 [Sarcophaga bullata]|nr:hypothetical protein DOY81_013497 [Sarcophaga bullata]
MSMLGFVYLVLILGWILIVLFLKCKKSITPHISLTDNYTDAIGSEQRRPSVHVIQLQSDVLENETHTLDGYHQQTYNLRQNSQRMPLAAVGERGIGAWNKDGYNHCFFDETYSYKR